MNEYDLETGAFSGVDEANQTTYYLRSSVLGGAIIDELGKDWQNNVFKSEGYVYAGGQRIAKQTAGQYEQHNPLTGSWVTINASNRYMNREERDPVGGTIPLDAPPSNSTYASMNFGGALFIEGGDPSDFSGGCFLDNLPTACSFVRPEAAELKSVSGVLKSTINSLTPVWVPDDSKDWWEPETPDPDGPDALGSYHIGNGGHFEWIPGIATTNFLTLRPQNSGFNLAGPGFSDEQMKILVDTLKTIKDEDCTNFINETLAKYKVDKEFNSLDKLLGKAVFGYYDRRGDYTDTDLGVDMESVILMRAAFVNRNVSAHTVRSRGIGHVFLSAAVFSRTDLYVYSNIADTPGFIVHELFHVAGIDQAVVDSQQMTNAIRQHCHLLGSDPIILQH